MNVVQPRFLWLFACPAPDGERGVEHQNALLRPLGERAVLWRLDAEVALELLVDVLEAGRNLDARLNGKAQTGAPDRGRGRGPGRE